MLFAIAPGSSLLSTYAGQHTEINSSVMPGMGLNRDKNQYLYPDFIVSEYLKKCQCALRNSTYLGTW